MHVKLKVLRGGSSGKEIAIKGPHFIIGRSEECNLRANSDAISRKHCAISLKQEDVFVRDLGSRNGTYLNGEKVENPTAMEMGDQLRVGPLEFLVTVSEKTKSKDKKPKTAAAKHEEKGSSNGEDLGGLISDWLSEADDADQRTLDADSGTREYKMDESDNVLFDTAKNSSPTSQTQQMPKVTPPEDEKPAKSKKKGKIDDAKRQLQKEQRDLKNSTKDTQEAAAQTLRKFFNRG